MQVNDVKATCANWNSPSHSASCFFNMKGIFYTRASRLYRNDSKWRSFPSGRSSHPFGKKCQPEHQQCLLAADVPYKELPTSMMREYMATLMLLISCDAINQH